MKTEARISGLSITCHWEAAKKKEKWLVEKLATSLSVSSGFTETYSAAVSFLLLGNVPGYPCFLPATFGFHSPYLATNAVTNPGPS